MANRVIKRQTYELVTVFEGYCPDCMTAFDSKIADHCTYCGKDFREYQTKCRKCGTGTHAWLWPSFGQPKCCMVCGTMFNGPHVTHPSFSELPPLSFEEVPVPYEEFEFAV